VLGTDMAKHFSEIGKVKTRVGAEDYDPKEKDKDLTIGMVFHLADISNSSKSWEVCKKMDRFTLFIEFFH